MLIAEGPEAIFGQEQTLKILRIILRFDSNQNNYFQSLHANVCYGLRNISRTEAAGILPRVGAV